MLTSFWQAIARRRRVVDHATNRRRLRLLVETLEHRWLMDATPHGGSGTLFDEHSAVMALIAFHEIHETAANPIYYVAQENHAIDGKYLWSDKQNWAIKSFDSDTLVPALHLPTTGDDVDIPATVDLVYDLTAADFASKDNLPTTLSNADSVIPSVKNNLRLHTVGVEGSLTFKENAKTELLMYFETMVVAHGGSLNMNESDGLSSVRMVIGASDWSKFSLAAPFDTKLDPLEFSRGLISHGTVSMTGEDVTPYITLGQLTKTANNIAAPKTGTVSFTSAAVGDPSKGSFKFSLYGAVPSGWTIGDRIVVSGTDPNKVNSATGASSDEEAVITKIDVATTTDSLSKSKTTTTITAQVQISVPQTKTVNGQVISLPPLTQTVGGLQYDHVPPKDPNTGLPYATASGSTPFGIQIANLSRSINIQSEDPYHTMARGHTMFMHEANVNIAGVGFLGLGRSDKRTVVDDVQFYTQEIVDAINQAGKLQDPVNYQLITGKGDPTDPNSAWAAIPDTGLNPRGRYAVHFHRAGIDETDGTNPNHPILKADKPAVVSDSVVVDSPGWGFVNHSGYVKFDNNVAFNVVGASFVTEVGNELGEFVGNLAIKGVGANTGEGIESRKVKQDFGFQGDGFWFQGASIKVENNIAVSQRHDGFVYFTQPLIQNYKWLAPNSDPTKPATLVSSRQAASTTTDILAKFYSPALISAFGGLGKTVDPGDVPMLSFKNNTALANGTGMETWFHQLGSPLLGSDLTQRALGSQIVGLSVANTRGPAMFDPYTNITTVKDALLVGNPASPGGTGMSRNNVTANFTYDNVTIRGFALGVAVPVNGLDIVNGGTYQNKRNFEITTANSSTRTVLFNDKTDANGKVSPLTFLSLVMPGNTTASVANEAARINIDLRTTYDPKNRDLSKLFNPDIIRMGTVWLNSFALGIDPADGPKQLYYYQQAKNFVPFPEVDEKGNKIDYGGPVADAFGNIVDYTGIEVPAEIFNKNNGYLMQNLGLAIGGTVAPEGAKDGMKLYDFTAGGTTVQASPRINGLIGGISTYQRSLDATSARYTTAIDTSPDGQSSPQYVFSYRFAKPNVDAVGAPALDASDNQTTTSVSVTVKIGNFGPAKGYESTFPAASYPVQLKTLTVNGKAVTIPAPTPPPQPAANAPTPQPLVAVPSSPYAAKQAAQQTNINITNANKAALKAYNDSVTAWNSYWKTYYNTPVKLSLRSSWNIFTGDLDGTGNLRTQLIYGDRQAPDLNLTSPDKNQLRRLTTTDPANPWAPGKWDASKQLMTGVPLGSDSAPLQKEVTGQFVAVMNPNDLSFGFSLKGQTVDNSFGHKSFEVFIGNLKAYLGSDGLPLLTPVTTTPSDPSGTSSTAAYSKILNYQSFKDSTQTPVAVVQHLQTIFFGVKDTAGNSKTFALTIYLDPTAPRVGGSADPSGSVSPSASMMSLANQLYLIDLDTFLMIEGTRKK